MGTQIRERAKTTVVNLRDGAAAEFDERRVDHRYERLRRIWTSCPACGGSLLRRPNRTDRSRIPEADGVCSLCGAALMAGPQGKVRLLKERRQPGAPRN